MCFIKEWNLQIKLLKHVVKKKRHEKKKSFKNITRATNDSVKYI